MGNVGERAMLTATRLTGEAVGRTSTLRLGRLGFSSGAACSFALELNVACPGILDRAKVIDQQLSLARPCSLFLRERITPDCTRPSNATAIDGGKGTTMDCE